MTPRLAFNLGAASILAGLSVLLTLDSLTLPWLAAVGLSGLALVFTGVVLIEKADEISALETTK